MKEEAIKKIVREGYAQIAKNDSSCCGSSNSCCGPASSCCGSNQAQNISRSIGYTDEEIEAVPEGANLGLGCGNPVALASLKEGETVLDLGSGAGFDCFLAAGRVGSSGRVIGVDMTPEMIERARENAGKGNYQNVEFRLGEIENLPAADNSVDVIISNCVINLAPDKSRVFREAFRVLKPGGRLMVSDIVVLKELPDALKSSIQAYIGCLAGAIKKDKYLAAIKAAGFQEVSVIDETVYPVDSMVNDPTAQTIIKMIKITPEEVKGFANSVISMKACGIKPL